jgi:hypothetical protein
MSMRETNPEILDIGGNTRSDGLADVYSAPIVLESFEVLELPILLVARSFLHWDLGDGVDLLHCDSIFQ